MSSRSAEAEQAVLNMLRRYEVLMMEDLSSGRPDFSWAQLCLAIAQLRRKNLIALRRVGLTYHIRSITHEWTHGQEQYQYDEESAAHHR
jgi:hypothetical protein